METEQFIYLIHVHVYVYLYMFIGDQSPPPDISSWFRSVGLGKTLPQALAQPHDIYAIGTQVCVDETPNVYLL